MKGGRMFVRGPNVMRGYLNPDADALQSLARNETQIRDVEVSR